jgi:hypothetical protein
MQKILHFLIQGAFVTLRYHSMRKLIVLLLLCSPLYATTWYATTSSSNMSAVTWKNTQGSSCAASGTTLTWASRAAGDIFDANGCTAITVDQDPGANGTVTLQTDSTNTSASGPFTCATATGPATLHVNIAGTANAVAVLTITGSAASPDCNITGNITAGSASGANGVADSHTAGVLTVTGNVTGGSVSGAVGYNVTAASPLSIVGNVQAGAAGQGYSSNSSGNITITGSVIGSDSGTAVGANGSGTGIITVVGNLIYGKKGPPISGPFYFTPGAANCFMAPSSSSWTNAPTTCTASGSGIQQMPSDTNIKTQGNVVNNITYGSYTGTNIGGVNSGYAY